MKYVPREYQRRISERIVATPRVAVWAEMGLGKTVVVGTALVQLADEMELGKVLVTGPKRVASTVWPAEVRKWSHLQLLRWHLLDADDFGLRAVYSPSGRRIGLEVRDVNTARRRLREIVAGSDVVLVTIEFLPWLVRLLGTRWPFDTVVLDESTLVRNHETERFRALRFVCPATTRFIELTGTPAPQSLLGLWSQMYLIDRGARLGETFTKFRNAFFMPSRFGPNGRVFDYAPRPGARDAILAKLEDVAISLRAEDWLELPERIDNDIRVTLPDQARALYDQMERKGFAELGLLSTGAPTVLAANAAVVVGKLLQVASGTMLDGAGESHEVHDVKVEALADILDATPGNVLCFYTYAADRERLLRRFPQARHLDESGVIDAWNQGEVRMLVAHPQAGGHGLNLQEGGDTVVWFTVPHSTEQYLQANARLHRQGQTAGRVVVHHIVAANTIDEGVLAARRQQQGMQKTLLEIMRDRAERLHLRAAECTPVT